MIESIKDIFVFGSNRAGISGKGAALYARQHWGAQNGVGEGPTGSAYALPTKANPYVTLPRYDLEQHVRRFLAYATAHPDERFLLTRIGCGLAHKGGKGVPEAYIAYLFVDAPLNVVSINDQGTIVGPASEWVKRVRTSA